MTNAGVNRSINNLYREHIRKLSGADVSAQRFRLASGQEMLIACDALLDHTGCHIEDRLPRAIEERNVLARVVSQELSQEWRIYEEWSVMIQLALESVHQQFPHNRRAELDEWRSWPELATDIHIAVKCSRQTIELFLYDHQHAPENTSIFAVPSHWNDFVGMLISGAIHPTYVSQIESVKMPGCLNGVHPKYSQR